MSRASTKRSLGLVAVGIGLLSTPVGCVGYVETGEDRETASPEPSEEAADPVVGHDAFDVEGGSHADSGDAVSVELDGQAMTVTGVNVFLAKETEPAMVRIFLSGPSGPSDISLELADTGGGCEEGSSVSLQTESLDGAELVHYEDDGTATCGLAVRSVPVSWGRAAQATFDGRLLAVEDEVHAHVVFDLTL